MSTALATEREFHDRQAAERARSFAAGRASLRFHDDDYLDHAAWIRPAFDLLGDVRGRNILDFGCGHGMASVVLARRGARVTAFDLSPGYVREATLRAEANSVRINGVCADGQRLPFAAGSFAAIWGNAILHHLDLATAATELRRVLQPGGVAVFCEPWGGNALLEFARRRLPYPSKERTPDERPLRMADLVPLRERFNSVEVRGFHFLGMLRRVLPNAGRWLERADARLLRALPPLEKWCRYVVIALRAG